MPLRSLATLTILTVGLAAVADERAGVPPELQAFARQHCLDCHQGDEAEGGLDFEALGGLDAKGAFERWVRIVDRVRDGEMPPPDSAEMEPEARTAFTSAADRWLFEHERAEWARSGRVGTRRLTNLQLERSLHDVLGIDVPLAVRMPEEPRDHGFTTIADGQSISHFHLERHVEIVDVALDEAFRRALSPVDAFRREFDGPGLCRTNPKRRCREPEEIDGLAVTWSGGPIFYGRLPATTAREDGWYRFEIVASGLNVPDEHGIWCSVRSGRCVSSAPLLSWVGSFEVTEEPGRWTFEAWLPKGHLIEVRPADTTLKKGRFPGGQVGAGEGTPQNLPGVALHSLTKERIHRGPDADGIRRLLFGDLDVQLATKKEPGIVKSDEPRADATRLMQTFAERAFRRPVAAEDVAPYTAFVHDALDAGEPFAEALRGGYRALLCSPRFLYFRETPGELDDHAVASRLSYFLRGTPPDAELRRLAEAGELRDPEVLKAQTRRLLSGEHGERFVADFAAQWLDLDQIDFTEPDRRLHPTFDVVVQQSMLLETRAFLLAMLRDDLGPDHLVDSDFTFLDSRLARYYRIDGVDGDEFRRVPLRADQPTEARRGGLLTQGAILKVTANGTTTSPVVRGVWVSERLLGVEIPPPPSNVPAIEPDVRGAKTIRDQLAKHEADPACASCHVNIDPPGFALENFDPAGRWRTKYPVGNRAGRGPVVDPGYDLPDGRPFDGVVAFQRLVAEDRERLAEGLVRQMLAYGTGAEVSYADRSAVHDVVAATADSNHGFRSLLEAVVTSPVFLSK